MNKISTFSRLGFIGRSMILAFVFCLTIGVIVSDANAKLQYYQLTQGGVNEYDMSSATTVWNYNYRANAPSGWNYYSPEGYSYASGLISIGFTFPYNGSTYTQLRMYSSGVLSLGTGTIGNATSNTINGDNGPLIAPFWEDLHFTGQGPGCGWDSKVTYRMTGVAPNRVFIAEWRDMEIGAGNYYGNPYGWGNRGTFQVQLFENGNIAFYYNNMEWKPSCGYWTDYVNYGMTSGISGSIGLGQSSTDFLSVTPGGPATTSYTTGKNDLNLNTPSISGGTGYLFVKIPEVRMSATPKIIDYGTVSAGSFATANIVVKHVSNEGVLNLSSVTISGLGASQYSIISTPGPLNPGQSGNIAVRFTPTLNGNHLATVTINSNAVDSGMQQILLSGDAVAPTIQIIPIGSENTPTRMFKKTRTLVGDSLTQSFLVKNIGAGTLVINPSSTIIGDNAAHYQITRWPLYPVAADQTDTMSITFAPTQDGGLAARAEIHNNATNGTQLIDLFGVGVVPRIELTPGEMLTFDSVPMGTTVCKIVRVSNPGTDTLRLTNNYMSSSDGDFSYTPLTGSDTVIAPGTFRDVTVCITPLQKGTRRARLRFTTNIPLTFEKGDGGQDPDGARNIGQSQQGNNYYPEWIRNDTSAKSVEIWANAVPSDKTIIAMGDFSDAVIGTESDAVVTMTNAGSEPIMVEEPFFSGSNASSFKATKAVFPVTVAPGANFTFTVVGTPALRGVNTAVMNIANKSEDRQYLQAVNLTVKGLKASSSVNETALSFEKLYLGEESSKTVTVSNTGDADQVYTATLVGAGYSLTSDAVSDAVAPGSSVVYTVKFAPTLKGTANGTLTLKSTHIADMSVALTGEADEKPVTQSVKGSVSMKGFVLTQNSPNPATGTTSFSFTSPNTSEVRIILADVTGKTVRELASGVYQSGEHTVNIVTGDIPSGSYLYILESEGVRLVRQMVITK